MTDRDDELTLDALARMPFGVPAMRMILNDRELFADKDHFQRREILLRAAEKWERLSGHRLDPGSIAGPFKKCMQQTDSRPVPFKALGGYGKYRHVPTGANLTAPTPQPPPIPKKPASRSKTGPLPAPESVREQWSDDGPVERNLGDGSFRVYAWCHANDAKENHGRWEIKIGHTGKGGLKSRLDRSQMKEPPRYLLCMRLQTEAEAISLEKALHTCLKFRDRRCRESLGTEWFLTSPQELVDLARVINPNLKEWETPPVPSW